MKPSPPTRPPEDTPREIYLAACQRIAGAFADDCYVFRKSGPVLSRKTDPFDFQIAFQSSHSNLRGKLVILWLNGLVTSPPLKKWRSTHPCLRKESDYVAGGLIGNLDRLPSCMEWNLAIGGQRDQQITDAVESIRRIILPYFALFDDIPALIERLAGESIPSFPPACALDFVMCFGSKSEAQRVAENLIRRLPGAAERYPTALANFRRDGLPGSTLSNHGEVLAAATLTFGLSDLRG